MFFFSFRSSKHTPNRQWRGELGKQLIETAQSISLSQLFILFSCRQLFWTKIVFHRYYCASRGGLETTILSKTRCYVYLCCAPRAQKYLNVKIRDETKKRLQRVVLTRENKDRRKIDRNNIVQRTQHCYITEELCCIKIVFFFFVYIYICVCVYGFDKNSSPRGRAKRIKIKKLHTQKFITIKMK